jgi:hypothetical protein
MLGTATRATRRTSTERIGNKPTRDAEDSSTYVVLLSLLSTIGVSGLSRPLGRLSTIEFPSEPASINSRSPLVGSILMAGGGGGSPLSLVILILSNPRGLLSLPNLEHAS